MADEKKVTGSTPKSKTKTKRQREIKAMDDLMPEGFSAPMHRSPQYAEIETRRYAEAVAKSGDTDAHAAMSRKADSTFGSSGQSFVDRTPLLYVDPMFDPILFLFPKDRIDEINKRLRHYYETDPIVGNAIDLHTVTPLNDFYLECENPENTRYFNDFKQRTHLLDFLRALVHDYHLCGEGIGLPIWDPHAFEFSHFNQYPPENIDIFRTYVTPTAFFFLKPDPKLAEKAQSAADIDKTLINAMPPDYVESLRENRPYHLGTDKKVIYLARNVTKYRHRGVSILSRCLKDLLYKDKLRLLQLTFVDRHMFPIKIFKIGSESRGWIPNKKHFDRLKKLLAQASNDPDFNILYHFGLTIDYVGTKDKITNLVPEFEWVERQVMAALFVNEELIHGGVPSAVRDTVSMRTLMQRYADVRDKVQSFMATHIFLPIAQARGLYKKSYTKRTQRETETIMKRVGSKDIPIKVEWIDKKAGLYRVANDFHSGIDTSMYDIPRPVWKKINFVNNIQEQQLMMKMEDEGKIPLEMIFDMFGWDPRTIREKLHQQESTEFDPTWRTIREEIAKDKDVRKQVFGGKKHKDWVLPKDETLDPPAPPAEQRKSPDKAQTFGKPPAQPARPGQPQDPNKKGPGGKPEAKPLIPPTRTDPGTELATPGPIAPTTVPEGQ